LAAGRIFGGGRILAASRIFGGGRILGGGPILGRGRILGEGQILGEGHILGEGRVARFEGAERSLFRRSPVLRLSGDWFDAVARLDTELGQHHGLDEPHLDTLYYHINQAEFAVGDFELAYRMHRRAGRAIQAVIEGNVDEQVRNEAIFRLARIYFQKD
jgi:hypothetical protein